MSVESGPQFQRFEEELERLSQCYECTAMDLLKGIISAPQFRAMKMGLGAMDKLLTRDMRWVALLGLGVDLKYVLFGERERPT